MMTREGPETVVLIHGLWMSPKSWEHWIQRYEARGLNVLAPAWPHMDHEVDVLRGNPAPFAKLGVKEIVDHYDSIIRGLDEPPIIVGHSFGGLFTQVLLDRGLGKAGVAIHPAPVKGILGLPWSTVRVGWAALKNPANNHRAVMLTEKQFRYAFANTLDKPSSFLAYERYAVPGPGRPLFQASLANFNPRAETRVNFRNNTRAPLLLMAGGRDHVVPASTTRSNYKLYRKAAAETELKVYEDRPHFTVGAPGWEEVADDAIDWALAHSQSTPAMTLISEAQLA